MLWSRDNLYVGKDKRHSLEFCVVCLVDQSRSTYVLMCLGVVRYVGTEVVRYVGRLLGLFVCSFVCSFVYLSTDTSLHKFGCGSFKNTQC